MYVIFKTIHSPIRIITDEDDTDYFGGEEGKNTIRNLELRRELVENPNTGEKFYVTIYEVNAFITTKDNAVTVVVGHEQCLIIQWAKEDEDIIFTSEYTR